MLTGVTLVVDQRDAFGVDDWVHLCNVGFKPVLVLVLVLSVRQDCSSIDGAPKEVLSVLSILFFLIGQGLFKSLHKLLVSVRVCGLAGVDPGLTFLLGVVNLPWLQLHLGCDQGMVSVAVSTVEGSGAADAVDGVASREDHVQLMPML